ncbi:MAG TPA: FIST N-terminal domain-containing protein [Chitinophagaceae bacterium]|nr:FIST N-terminal domain-containing protein [Chitinophagaceae bacterium]
MKAKSIKGRSTEEIRSALQQSIADGFKPTLALVFLSVMNEIETVCSLLDKESIAIFGANTHAEFTEKETENTGIAVLLLDINRDYFKIVLNEFGSGSIYETACHVAESGLKTFSNPAFIISASNYKTSAEEIVAGLVEKVGPDISLFGGRAGEIVNFEGRVFTNNAVYDGGLIALIFDQDKIKLRGVAASGWKPIGTEKTITKCNGHMIYTIDNQPAFEVVKKFLGKEIINDDNKTGLVRLNMLYPLQIFRQGRIPKIIPALFANTEDQSLVMPEDMSEGTIFRFSMPPDFDVIDTVIQTSREIKENEMPEADALVIFSCIGRLSSMGPMATAEVEGLAATWDKPMIGFFSLGEFGRVADGNPEFHGTTVSWVALKEK